MGRVALGESFLISSVGGSSGGGVVGSCWVGVVVMGSAADDVVFGCGISALLSLFVALGDILGRLGRGELGRDGGLWLVWVVEGGGVVCLLMPWCYLLVVRSREVSLWQGGEISLGYILCVKGRRVERL